MKLYQKISLILLGLFLTIVILEIGLRIAGFTILSIQDYRNLQSIKQKGSFRIMCLGESTTQGQYPPFLEEILNQRNIGIKFSVIDKGLRGTKTAIILAQLEANLDKYQPDMVVTMMGINDDGGHMPYEAKATSKTILILKSLKVYKLTRLIWLHMTTKLKWVGLKDKFKEVPEKLDYIQQEQASKKAIELNPKDDSAYRELGWLYRDQGRFAEAEQLFKKVIKLNPNSDSAYAGLGWLYICQERFTEAEQLFKKAIECNPDNERLCGYLAILYSEMGNDELSKTYTEKMNNLRGEYYNFLTVNNYRTLKQILDKRKIKLACVQYPVRNIESLKKIFKEEMEGSIVFVDNEKIFKDAIGKEGYKEYFTDMFGGDFGHCTPKGNRLLAENIANVMLKEYFNK